MSKPTVAITGANGFLGSTLVDYFASKGWEVVGLIRNPDIQPKKHHVQYRKYDITKELPKQTLANVDYLVHTAYIKHSRQQPDAMAINIAGAKNILAASRKAGVAKNVFISSMSAHERAESIYGRQKLAIEKLFDSKKDISLRCGLIIGNGGIVKQMVDFMRSKHAVPLIGGGKQPLQSVSVTDLCTVVERCFERKVSGTLTIANPEVFSYRQFYEAIARTFKIRVIFIPVPLSALLGIALTVEALRLPVGFGKDNVLGLKQLESVDNKKDLQKLGIELEPLGKSLERSGLH
jgi:nucleoside-diphosphate-sugar epimerase